MRDLDVKPTPSRDLDIKRDYQLKLRQLLFKNTLMDILKLWQAKWSIQANLFVSFCNYFHFLPWYQANICILPNLLKV